MSQQNQSPFETNFHDVPRRAAVLGASDLHIEPFEGRVVIRVRVDGVLGAIQEIVDAPYIERFLQQAKRACRFDMSRIGTPQDARFQASDVPFDLRASLMPTLFGEKIVLRLLERDLIEANLLFASAQRLVPKNCSECAREDFDAVPLVNAVFGEQLVPMRSGGCASCNHTGVRGRVLFFEHIARETVPETNQKQLVSCGSLKACALEALKKGEVNAQNASAFY